MKERILVVDDERSIRDMLRMTLEYEGYSVVDAESGTAALDLVRSSVMDAVLLDIKMQGLDGLETLERIRELDASLPVVILTGHGTFETAVEATRKGAFDFLSKPPDREKILITLRNAFTQTRLLRENLRMREEMQTGGEILGTSRAIAEMISTIRRVAPTEAYVLITGENGTGKELVAHAVHSGSKRSDKPFVEVNCAAIPAELIESELFGHEKGAFTGATSQRIGKFEQAHPGTIFLDEIGDMSQSAQAKVLRILEEGNFERVGGNRRITVDVRVLAATNKILPDEIRENRFREDLYHRLNVIPINVPPLRDRREDIPVLVAHFLRETARKNGLPVREMDEEALDRLRSMHWPGNVRELRNAVERLSILTSGIISRKDVERYVAGPVDPAHFPESDNLTFQDFKDRAEAEFLRRQLERFQWNVSRTAEELDIQRSHLYTKIRKYGLLREGGEE